MLPLIATALAGPPESELVYFVLVDRFDNGDSRNDDTIDLTDPHAFHGGDLAGITRRLPYLAELGVDTLWLSPVFSMRTEKFHGHGAFHGYWVNDLDTIAPRFGGNDAMIALAEAAEAAGMRLVLDMVYNHTAFDAPRVSSHPDWFHTDGTIEDWNDPTQLQRGQIHGLPDLAQERDAVYHYLLGRSLYWAQTLSVDGFRIDAVRHMPDTFFHALSADLKAHLGEDFWLLGEDFQGDAKALSQTFRSGGFDAMFDFPLRYALVDVMCHDIHPGRLAATLSLDRLYDDANGLVTFLDNHDLPRITSECGGDQGAVEAAMLVQFALRGTPAITYGTEWLLDGPGEPDNRADMPWAERGPAADTIATLAAMRSDNPVLVSGQTRIQALQADLLILERSLDTARARLVINRGAVPMEMPGTGWSAGEGHPLAAHTGAVPAKGVAVLLADDVVVEAPASVAFSITADVMPGERLVAVGAGPELGHWDPSAGLSVPGSLNMPVGTVLSFKLVRLLPDGSVQWEQTDNRYHLVGPRGDRIEARWEE